MAPEDLLVNLDDYEARARSRLDPPVYDYMAGAADDELGLARNIAAWRDTLLVPRALCDVDAVDPSTVVLGQRIAAPILFAPTAFHRMITADGERATARAAARCETIFVLSSFSSTTLEEVAAAAAAGPRWYQLYCHRDPGVTREVVDRAVAAGYGALCITVDIPRAGRRERDLRNRFEFPPGVSVANFPAVAGIDASGPEGSVIAKLLGLLRSPKGWREVEWIASLSRLPIVLKGIMAPEDARLAASSGAAAVVVSNHGGRQLDSSPATRDMLPGVVEAVAGAVEVLVDGGIRRGSDVVKALALGARAVLVGRPYVWGLACDGEAGACRVYDLLRMEVETTMAQVGCSSVSAIGPGAIYRPR